MIDRIPLRVRQICLVNISTEQLRVVPEEIRKWKKIRNSSIETYQFQLERNQNLYIASEVSPDYICLKNLIEEKGESLSLETKLDIVKQTVKALIQLEALGDSYAHGHLSTSNILVSPDYSQILLTDFGFTSLRAYCSMLAEYTNKDQHTAPEFLVQKGRTVKKPTHKADIYALSLVIYQLLANRHVLEDLGIKDRVSKIVEERIRPPLQQAWSQEIKDIIQQSWDPEAEKRPQYSDILERLSKIET